MRAAQVTSALVPWNTCGAYMSGVFGVSTASYLPYCFFNLLSPVLDVLFGSLASRFAAEGPSAFAASVLAWGIRTAGARR